MKQIKITITCNVEEKDFQSENVQQLLKDARKGIESAFIYKEIKDVDTKVEVN